jgi:very-short-patch-repair endonuclease
MADGLSFTRAKAFRKALTPPEFRLWQVLRRDRVGKIKFRRQHPVGPYILDFYCAAAKLAIEIDGAVHNEPKQIAHDRRRTAWLHERGVRVVRLSAVSVMTDQAAVVDFIYDVVRSRLAEESPPPDR